MLSRRCPIKLKDNLSLFNEEEKKLLTLLLEEDQQHLFADWDVPGVNDLLKRQFIQQIAELNSNCGPGGIKDYLKRARRLLQASKSNENPFEGWIPSIPQGIHLEPFTPTYQHYENLGFSDLGKCGFVLVAGGLGERLGYHGIKVELPVETVTHITYLGYYCSQIKAIQTRYGSKAAGAGGGGRRELPLAIMVSDDTKALTEELLEKNAYFGLSKSQITLLKQGKVPALMSNNAHIALVNDYEIDAKPHGHGDVHSLLHSSGLAKRWLEEIGIEWIVFFQDTNALAFFTLPAMLGVSKELSLEVNSMAIPRFAKQAVGAITKLIREEGKSSAGALGGGEEGKGAREMTINVEYNQLDPLLRSTIAKDGDINDPVTGHSPFPGNINQLLFHLPPYVKIIEATNGLMPEFVNPKYKDETRTVFKKPTRLECMMQDYPKLLPTGSKVGFTMAPAWICYSPCKNNATDAAAAIASGIPSASPLTAESDQYQVWVKMLQSLGCEINLGEEEIYLGIKSILSPRLIFHPSFAIFPGELSEKFLNPGKVKISSRSTLIIEGNNVMIDSLYLDGSLSLSTASPPTTTTSTAVGKEGSSSSSSSSSSPSLLVRVGKEKEIHNAGHVIERISPEDMNYLEKDRMRGYFIKEIEMKRVQVDEGNYFFDGVNLIEAEALEEIGGGSKKGGASGSGVGGGVGGGGGNDTCCNFFSC